MNLFAPILQRWVIFMCAVIVAAAMPVERAAAQTEIALSPLRQVLTPAAPTATYRVSNPSSRIIEARLRWLDLVATQTGYRQATREERAHLSAAPYLAVWPAFFRLEPGASETVTVALKQGARPPEGERRSHLLFETAAVRTPLRRAGGAPELDIGLGVSTPVILRNGDGAPDAEIGQTRLLRTADGLLELETHVAADGPFSAYGRIDLVFTPRRKGRLGSARLLKRAENIAAYPDAARRRIAMPLGVERLPAGVLEIRYLGAAEYEGREFARRAFEIAPPEAAKANAPARPPATDDRRQNR